MKYRMLGQTGFRISEVGLGTWPMGGPTKWAQGYISYGSVDDTESLALLRRARELGVNFIDTADIYGDGHSEELIAQALGGDRDCYVATKVGYDMYGGRQGKVWSAEHINYAVEQSLRRLRRDVIDLYQLHTPPIEVIRQGEVFETLERLKQQGKIRHYGLSIFTAEDAAEALKQGNPAAFQVSFNLLDQRHITDLFPSIRDRGVGIIVRSPLASGFLTGTIEPDHDFPETDHRSRMPREQIVREVAKVEMLRFLVKPPVQTLPEAALAYILSYDAVSVVIPGAMTIRELEDNVSASDVAPLAAEDVRAAETLYREDFGLAS